MQPERAEILRSITRILEQDGYITKEEAVGIMELIQERSFGASGEEDRGNQSDILYIL